MEAANVSSDHPLSVFKIFIVGFAAMAGFSCATSGIEVKVEMYASVPDESGKGCFSYNKFTSCLLLNNLLFIVLVLRPISSIVATQWQSLSFTNQRVEAPQSINSTNNACHRNGIDVLYPLMKRIDWNLKKERNKNKVV
ncbi:Metal-staphylopine-binding protein CntA [Trichinella pseudospiralis]